MVRETTIGCCGTLQNNRKMVEKSTDSFYNKIETGESQMFNIVVMSENIKEYRNKKGLSQYEFAERLGVSPQAVSKWECGQSCPSIENLCAISELLDASIDELIGEKHDRERMMIGIDGGGTRTEFVLFSENGRILNRIVLGDCNPNTVGIENAMNVLKMGIDTLLKIEGKVCGIFLGAAGLDSGNNTSQITIRLKEKYPKIKIQCENELFNVIACGKNLDKCVAVVCGTGMIIYANQNRKIRRFGGRGYLLDKGGSGYHIGRDAICAALDAREGLGKHTILTDLVEEKLGNRVWESIQEIYSQNQSYVASFAPCVFKAYENGDEVAAQILEQNADCLAQLINFAVDNCDVGKYVVASGGIIRQNPAFCELLKERLDSRIELEVPEYPSVYGACIMCCRLCGVDASLMEEHFMMSYASYR